MNGNGDGTEAVVGQPSPLAYLAFLAYLAVESVAV
jgi:hypothetical protein